VEWLNEETNELAAIKLYDLRNDPDENRNVAGNAEYATVVDKMKAQLKAGWQAALPD